MSERVKVLLYTLVAGGVLWLAIERFLGTTDEYASTLNIRTTARSAAWDPENEVINPVAPFDPSARRGESAETPEHEGGRFAKVRADSDGDMVVREVSVAGMSEAEAALLERLDPDLLRTRVPTRALDLSLVGCTIPPDDEAAAGSPRRTRAADITVGVRFRHGSVAIKGASLTRVDRLVGAFRDCATGLLVIERNPEGRVDVADDERLMTRREEELKYYLLQRRVPKELMRFPERS